MLFINKEKQLFLIKNIFRISLKIRLKIDV